MKTFILKTVIFSETSIFLISILFILTNLLVKKNADFSFETPVNNVIFGHSHSECAFNDSLINNFKNLSESRESYFYSFQKIKKVLAQNKEIKNVFIEFSNKQITKEMDSWIWDDLSINSKSLYLPFLDKDDINLLFNKNSKSFITGNSKSFRENITNSIMCNYDYTNKIGGYRRLERDITYSLIINLKRNAIPFRNKKNDISIKNIEYLDKIISYCNKKNVNIFFVRSPQHLYCRNNNNEMEFIKIMNEKFKNIVFLDFNDFPLKNEEYADYSHLNYKGARKFSLWFNELLEKGLLSKTNKRDFIIDEIKKINDNPQN